VRKIDWVLREILFRVYEKNEIFMTQKSIATTCGLSMDTVNRLVTKLDRLRAVEKRPFGFRVTEPKKVLTYWAATRNLPNDIAYMTFSPYSPDRIEDALPEEAIFTGYSGYKFTFKTTPVPYEEVFVYADPDEVRKKFPESNVKDHNLVVLKSDPHLKLLKQDRSAPFAQLYVDLWQIGGPTANRFLLEMERKIESQPVEALKTLVERARKSQEEE